MAKFYLNLALEKDQKGPKGLVFLLEKTEDRSLKKRVGPLQLYLERSETGLLGSCLPSQRKTAQLMKLSATGRKSLGAMSPLAREFDLLHEFTPLPKKLPTILFEGY